MRRAATVSAFGSGLVFAIGLGISGMTRPGKVLGFLDVGGAWDPSLGCVMAGALAVAALGFRLSRGRERPLFGDRFHLPEERRITWRLVFGAAVFGIGWGLAGFCPGPALVSLASGAPAVLLFVATMAIGSKLGGRLLPSRPPH